MGRLSRSNGARKAMTMATASHRLFMIEKGPKASKFIEFYKKRAFNGSNPPKPGEEAA
jgi:hypothetical protein